MTDWYNPGYGFRTQLTIIPPAVQAIGVDYPITVIIPKDEWVELKKLRSDYLDTLITYWDPDIAATPVDVAIPRKIVESTDSEGNETVHVVFNAVDPISAVSMDYYMYYGNPNLLGYVEYPYTDADYVIHLTPDDYNYSLTFSRPGEHWVSGISDKVNARFTLNFFGVNAKLIMKKGPDRGILELRFDDDDPIYVDTYSHIETEELVYITEGVTPGQHALRGRVTGDKNAASDSFTIEFAAIDYSILVEAIQSPEEINSQNPSYTFLTGI